MAKQVVCSMRLLVRSSTKIGARPEKALRVIVKWSVRHRILLISDFVTTAYTVGVSPYDPPIVQNTANELDRFAYSFADLIWCVEEAEQLKEKEKRKRIGSRSRKAVFQKLVKDKGSY
jgi:hypothetical protein